VNTISHELSSEITIENTICNENIQVNLRTKKLAIELVTVLYMKT